MTNSILVADNDSNFLSKISETWPLELPDFDIANTPKELLSLCAKPINEDELGYDLILVDCNFLIEGELDLLNYIKEQQNQAEVILLSSPEDKKKAETLLMHGADSYLIKPISTQLLEQTTKRAIERADEHRRFKAMEESVFEDLLGDTPAMKRILKTIRKVAPSNSTLLITGESGTGKEFFANIIHRLSKRASKKMVAINCGAIPENLVEAELFGIKKGAFTGASADKKGLVEEADGGTLFLDELGELPLSVQVKLLRFLENREFRRVGDTELKRVDVRIIAATNKNLIEQVQLKGFREDLYYRLNTFQLHLPPLRERGDTLPHLIKYFALKFAKQEDKNIHNITQEAQHLLSTYSYPGNIRELSNIIEHAVVLSEKGVIEHQDLPNFLIDSPSYKALNASYSGITNTSSPETNPTHLDSAPTQNSNYEHTSTPSNNILSLAPSQKSKGDLKSLSEYEKEHIVEALSLCDNNQSEVARRLGVSRSTLWRKIGEHKIELGSKQ
ncbi:sigma-54 dependent transcriptional regulator [bacterium]|nr:sigma-54 dependent transcriptional regulator [bacterium]